MRNARDQVRRLTDHPTDGPAAYTDALAAHNDMIARWAAEAARLDDLIRRRDQAAADDRQAAAEALRNGKPAPKPRVDKAEADITECRRTLAALEVAIDQTGDAVTDTVLAVRDQWLTQLEDADTDARVRYAEAIDEIERARADLMAALTTQVWLVDYQPGRGPKPLRPMYPLTGTNGETFTAEQLMAALRHDVNRPRPDRPIVLAD